MQISCLNHARDPSKVGAVFNPNHIDNETDLE